MQQLNKVSTLETVALCRFVSKAEKRHNERVCILQTRRVFQPPLFTDNADIASNADMNIPAACGGCNTLFSVFFYN